MSPAEILSPLVVAGVFILLCSLIHEPDLQRFSALMISGAAYLGGGLGGWEVPFCALMNSSYHCQARRSAQAGYVAARRFTKVAAILATELRWAFITHAEGGSRDVDVLDQHQAARVLQPELFLELQRRHRRHGAKMLVLDGLMPTSAVARSSS
jgi:hypothetical protein